MNKAEQLNVKIRQALLSYSLEKVEKYFKDLKGGDGTDQSYWLETHSQKDYPVGMYLYLGATVKVTQPKIIIEIGGDRGVSALIMASELPSHGRLYSIDIRNGWEYIPQEHPSIVKILGESTNTDLLRDINLNQVDMWFIDGRHDHYTVTREVATYSPFWHLGTVVMFDDIDLYPDAWEQLNYDKYESREIHNQGFGVIVV